MYHIRVFDIQRCTEINLGLKSPCNRPVRIMLQGALQHYFRISNEYHILYYWAGSKTFASLFLVIMYYHLIYVLTVLIIACFRALLTLSRCQKLPTQEVKEKWQRFWYVFYLKVSLHPRLSLGKARKFALHWILRKSN